MATAISAVSETNDVLDRICDEYRELPGLCLTEAQARRLWGLDPVECRIVLSSLVDQGVLRRTADGSFIRAAA